MIDLKCINCGAEEVFTGYGETNTPQGHDMIYAMYRCPKCKPGRSGLSGVPNLFGRFYHNAPESIVFLDLRGGMPRQVPWFDLREELVWSGMDWQRKIGWIETVKP